MPEPAKEIPTVRIDPSVGYTRVVIFAPVTPKVASRCGEGLGEGQDDDEDEGWEDHGNECGYAECPSRIGSGSEAGM